MPFCLSFLSNCLKNGSSLYASSETCCKTFSLDLLTFRLSLKGIHAETVEAASGQSECGLPG